ncbi:MAG: TraR/DksA family transcriptional regulator [Gammaproteobacteria bacterium]
MIQRAIFTDGRVVMDLTSCKTRLIDRRSELLERGKRIHENIHNRDEPLSADFAEPAIELEDRELVEALDDAVTLELRQIERALKRIEAEEYEFCESCGEEVGEQRLKALPYTTLCIRCAKEQEERTARR